MNRKTFGNSKLKVIYAIAKYGFNVYFYKYLVVNKTLNTVREIPKWNCGNKKTTITLELKLIEYMGKPYQQFDTNTITVNANHSSFGKDYPIYFCDWNNFIQDLEFIRSQLEDSLASCEIMCNPNRYIKTEGIFENAKCGDLFETIDGRVAHYLFKYYANHEIRPEMEFHQIYVEGDSVVGNYKRDGETTYGGKRNCPKIIRKLNN